MRDDAPLPTKPRLRPNRAGLAVLASLVAVAGLSLAAVLTGRSGLMLAACGLLGCVIWAVQLHAVHAARKAEAWSRFEQDFWRYVERPRRRSQ